MMRSTVVLFFSLHTFGFLGADAQCSTPLGMEDSSIPDDNIQSWSPILGKMSLAKARLNDQFAWCSAEDVKAKNAPFLQITLAKPRQITGIATKGFADLWVTEYLVEYKVGNSFQRYKEPDSGTEIIKGNLNGDTVLKIAFAKPFVTQVVRVVPVTRQGLSCLRMELYGCDVKTVDSRVWARWTNGLYYKGVIDSETAATFHIKYDDGDQITLSKTDSKAIVLDVISPKSAVNVGTEVIAWWPNNVKYYPGRVDKIENDRFYIKYDDGDQGWARIDQLRVYSG